MVLMLETGGCNFFNSPYYSSGMIFESPVSSTSCILKQLYVIWLVLLEASNIFRRHWLRCKEHGEYVEKKAAFLEDQRAWDKEYKTETIAGGRKRKG